jgi:hypothetical protein
MKVKAFAAVAALCIATPGIVFAQRIQDIDRVPIAEFSECPAKFQCDDRSSPISNEEERIFHNLRRIEARRMIYKVGLRPQPQEFVLVSEVYERFTKTPAPVEDFVKKIVLVQPVDVGLPWQYVPPRK